MWRKTTTRIIKPSKIKMMYILTKKEEKEHRKELIKFCRENHCLMWNFMLTIKQIRNEPKHKKLEEILKKQASDYKKLKGGFVS